MVSCREWEEPTPITSSQGCPCGPSVTGPCVPVSGLPGSGPLGENTGLTLEQRRTDVGCQTYQENIQPEVKGGALSPLVGNMGEVFMEKVTFAKKQRLFGESHKGNGLVACVHQGLVRCQE